MGYWASICDRFEDPLELCTPTPSDFIVKLREWAVLVTEVGLT